MRRDDVRELRRGHGLAARVGQQAPLRVADSGLGATEEKYRFIVGLVDYASGVTIGASSFPIDNVRALAGGRSPVSDAATEVTVNDAIGSYSDNDPILAVWDADNSEWIDATISRYTRIRAKVNEASGVAENGDGWDVDNIERLEGSALPSGAVQGNNAKRPYSDNDNVVLVWNDTQKQWEDDTDLTGDAVRFDFILHGPDSPTAGQSLTAGSWNDTTRKWTDGGGTVTLLTDNGDGTYDEGSTQAVKWAPNVAVTPAEGEAYRGHGYIIGGVYKVEAVYQCDGVTWSDGT